ncbi:bleomycin resistance protein [Microbacterium sp.]|uniref:bleomycin resistance protein n=1 Tax=Microbacterium sp. TaxID=51671 RepID=UPI003C2901A8
MTDRSVPNLPSRDFASTVEFYGRFGFFPTFRDDTWLILRRDAIELEFFSFPDLEPYASSFMCSIRVDDLDDLFGAVAAAQVPQSATGIPRLTPVATRSWGQRAAYLIDNDGTQLNLIENSVAADDDVQR